MNNLVANWHAPKNIRALTTKRIIGASENEFAHNNFGQHVDDKPEHVQANRLTLRESLKLPGEPIWLKQTHTNKCLLIEDRIINPNADAAVTRKPNLPLVIMTADCLPILICDKSGTEIAAIHAGWRGLADGIIENTLKKLNGNPDEYMAWIGPAICINCYETGDEVFEQFKSNYSFADKGFSKTNSKLHANLPKLAELILNNLGIKDVFQSGACTYESNKEFYSYRRSSKTGRMATLIWFQGI
jgi:polyphenol oxidase